MRYFVNLLTKKKQAPYLWPMKRQEPKLIKSLFFNKNPEDYGWSIKRGLDKKHKVEEEEKK